MRATKGTYEWKVRPEAFISISELRCDVSDGPELLELHLFQSQQPLARVSDLLGELVTVNITKRTFHPHMDFVKVATSEVPQVVVRQELVFELADISIVCLSHSKQQLSTV